MFDDEVDKVRDAHIAKMMGNPPPADPQMNTDSNIGVYNDEHFENQRILKSFSEWVSANGIDVTRLIKLLLGAK